MKSKEEIVESASRFDIYEQAQYEARKAVYYELFDLRMKSINILLDKNFPNRDLNLLQTKCLISIAEEKLDSLPEVGDMEPTEMEDETVTEEVINDSSSDRNSTTVPEASDVVL
ncbi:hypothetical protein MKX03_036298, partial [Papaver bracteatum]